MGRPPRIRRNELIEVARRVFTRKGFDGSTLADIANELGVTPAAVLRHVPSKEALFVEAMHGGRELPGCLTALANADVTGDQRPILRMLALELIPLLHDAISVSLVVNMRTASHRSLVLPPETRDVRSRRRRGLRIVEGYFQRAMDAGTIRLRDARAAARLFIGSLHAYVVAHDVIGFEAYPLESYVDALIDLWTEGAIVVPRGGTSARKKAERSQNRRAARRRSADRRGRDLLPSKP